MERARWRRAPCSAPSTPAADASAFAISAARDPAEDHADLVGGEQAAGRRHLLFGGRMRSRDLEPEEAALQVEPADARDVAGLRLAVDQIVVERPRIFVEGDVSRLIAV